ncbi:hypothetical protein Glove_851g8 [Diversispora epigaea]|uniref:Protein kinase domain-containing protein n=1 Tax=Diversispora epigaea TaxID=1348612 RepID=A0A397G1A7_9GLOM|nr:hypothetical protein Glove_851g8 [Diversispora epigaea]
MNFIGKSNNLIKCLECNKKTLINSSHLCKLCNVMSSLIVESGNKYIDDFIKETQFTKESWYSDFQWGNLGDVLCEREKSNFLVWVPYENLTNMEHIGRGGFSQIYKATWEKPIYKYERIFKTEKTVIVLKVLNDSQNVNNEFLKELKYTYQLWNEIAMVRCYGVTQNSKTKNYAFVLEYAKNGDLHHFLNKNFAKITWRRKIYFFRSIVSGIRGIHYKKIMHRDLHSGNILIIGDSIRISDLGLSQPANFDSNLSRKSQMYGIIPYMAPELFKGQTYSYASDIYSLGMIMWELTSGHRPFHDREYGPKLILDILDGKRPEITEDTPECWANLMKRCWHPDPSQRPTIQEISTLIIGFWPHILAAEKKRDEMIELNKPFVNNPGYVHPNSRYYSTLLNPMLESISSTISDLLSNESNDSNDNFDIMDINSNQIKDFVQKIFGRNHRRSK